MSKRVLPTINMTLLEDDLTRDVGKDAWIICDLIMHGYGKRQIAKHMNMSYLEVKQITTRIQQVLIKYEYVVSGDKK